MIVWLKRAIFLCNLLSLIFLLSSASAQQDSAQNKLHLLVLPVIARSIETSWSFGTVGAFTFHIGKKDSTVRTSNFQVLGLYSLKKQLITALNGTLYFPKEKYILTEQFSFSFFPDKFWGLGKSTPDSNEEPYNFKQVYIYLHGQHALAKYFYLGFLYEYQNLLKIEYQHAGLFDKENVVGRKAYHVSGLGLSLMYDTRNNAFAPDKGVLLQTSFNHFDPIEGSDFSYTNYVVDLRSYIKTFKKQVIAFQAYGFFNNGDTPLRSLASLGGANSMRGYYAGRYRDKNLAVLQAEYRIPVIGRLGVVAFGGIGNVTNHPNDLNFDLLKYSYGGGMRFALRKSEKLNLRFDYGIGKGKKDSGFYFQLGEAF